MCVILQAASGDSRMCFHDHNQGKCDCTVWLSVNCISMFDITHFIESYLCIYVTCVRSSSFTETDNGIITKD